jgi:hypothetical protein
MGKIVRAGAGARIYDELGAGAGAGAGQKWTGSATLSKMPTSASRGI